MVQRASELTRRSFLRYQAAVAGAAGEADGELLARRGRCMQERGQVQCVRLLGSRATGEGRDGRLPLVIWRSCGAEASDCADGRL